MDKGPAQMTDWADKARVELDEFVGDLWAEDGEGCVKLYVGLDGEDAAEYLRENFIPRSLVEALHKQFEDTWKVHHSHATMSADNIRELFEYLLEKS